MPNLQLPVVTSERTFRCDRLHVVLTTGSCAMLRQTLYSAKRFPRRCSASSGGSRSRTRCGPDLSV